jgi:ATP-dependent Lon protease
MRDFRDAKAMAETLRKDLKARSIDLSHSDSLELVARMLGLRNWNVLSARIQDPAPAPAPPAAEARPAATLPVLPMRDITVFPEMTLPLYVGRPKSLKAVEAALAGGGFVLLVAQRRAQDDDPGQDQLHPIGVLARILESMTLPDGSMKVSVRGLVRVRLTSVIRGEPLEAGYETLEGVKSPERVKELVTDVLARFAERAKVDMSAPPQAMASLAYTFDPGRLADLMVPHLSLNVAQAQDLLETTDPAERLEKIRTLMQPKAA